MECLRFSAGLYVETLYRAESCDLFIARGDCCQITAAFPTALYCRELSSCTSLPKRWQSTRHLGCPY
jgi:hypothetical protein